MKVLGLRILSAPLVRMRAWPASMCVSVCVCVCVAWLVRIEGLGPSGLKLCS